ncbi:hypothetical protein WMY93_004525 [Mugilogobius chulae]|uniref:Uncharacterized protein n=1 Tax=Mugilogobius chulae TaxID=88201 RepID=A0AAW0PRD5_9GOBI
MSAVSLVSLGFQDLNRTALNRRRVHRARRVLFPSRTKRPDPRPEPDLVQRGLLLLWTVLCLQIYTQDADLQPHNSTLILATTQSEAGVEPCRDLNTDVQQQRVEPCRDLNTDVQQQCVEPCRDLNTDVQQQQCVEPCRDLNTDVQQQQCVEPCRDLNTDVQQQQCVEPCRDLNTDVQQQQCVEPCRDLNTDVQQQQCVEPCRDLTVLITDLITRNFHQQCVVA